MPEQEKCEFCNSIAGPFANQDMGGGRTMFLCERCRRLIANGDAAAAQEQNFAGVWTICRVYLRTPPMTYPAIPVCTVWDKRDAKLIYELLKAAEERKRVPRWHFWIEVGERDETVTPPLHLGKGGYGS